MNLNLHPEGVNVWLLVFVGIVLMCQSTYLFLDARKREHYPWVWGIWGMIQCPIPLIVYMIVVRKIFLKKKGS